MDKVPKIKQNGAIDILGLRGRFCEENKKSTDNQILIQKDTLSERRNRNTTIPAKTLNKAQLK